MTEKQIEEANNRVDEAFELAKEKLGSGNSNIDLRIKFTALYLTALNAIAVEDCKND